MMRRVLLVLIILSNIFAVSGCWDKIEIDELRIITGIAIELTNTGDYRVIMQTINPTAMVGGADGGGSATFTKCYQNHAAEGESLFDAFGKLSRETTAQRFFAHTWVIIISEEVAREKGVAEIVDYLVRNRQFRLDTWLLIGRGDLISLLDSPDAVQNAPSQLIKDIVDKIENTDIAAPLKVGRFAELLASDSRQVYTAGVERIPNAAFVDGPGHQISDGNVPEPVQYISINYTALFRQDKLVGWLSGDASCGMQWLTGRISEGFVSFDNPDSPGDKIGVMVVGSKIELKPELKNGNVVMKIKIEAESFVEEVQGQINLDKVSAISRLEAAQSNKIKEEVKACLQKAQQEYEVDVFGFGEAVHRSYPQEWQSMEAEWSEIYPYIQVDIQVLSKIRHTSHIDKPLGEGNK